MELNAALYLIPVNISNAPLRDTLPEGNLDILRQLRYLIVENIRTARRFLKRCDPGFDIGGITFFELNRHTDLKDVSGYLEPLRRGEAVGVMSEAGCPAIADPGSLPVSIAQEEGLKVIPLVGPSSILMSLMASGFNGQGFSFNGYLPIEQKDRERKLKDLEALSRKNDMTQIFIETPYRNNRMLAALVSVLRDDTLVCVACDITDPDKESVVTLPVKKWRHAKYDYDKRPAIFLLYSQNPVIRKH
ncbi:MAG: SAM-dependent methyltransferase [Muribaculaceae bacterium]|nr:SAM-dependent methyltransferase [Muribaculaceae bacterium]